MQPSNSIHLTDVRFDRAGRTVLGPLSWSAGEKRIGIVGRNGSGKSTLARLVMGLLKPDAGQLRVHGVDVFADRRAALKTVGMIFQNPDHQIIFPTCEEEVAFGLTQMGQTKEHARAAARAALAAHGVGHWADTSTAALSQGQRHLLCLISVLAMTPKVLILDEPFAGLDIPTATRLHRRLMALEQQVVMITHDPSVLLDFDRVIWLEDGVIKHDGAAPDVLAAFSAEMKRQGATNVEP